MHAIENYRLQQPWRSIALGVAVAWILPADPVVTAHPQSDQIAAEVRDLVHDLADGDSQIRQAAEERIVELGVAALPHLPPPHPRVPTEIGLRLARIRRHLQQLQAQTPSRPAVVTLQGQMTFGQAIERLEQQSGNRIVDARQSTSLGSPLVVRRKHTSFWHALDHLMELSQTKLDRNGRERSALVLTDRPESAPPRSATHVGSFRFELVDVTRLGGTRGPNVSDWRMIVVVWWEPRLQPICLKHRGGPVRGPAGHLIRPSSGVPQEILTLSGIPHVEIPVTLLDVPAAVTQIATLQGDLEAVLLGQEVEFVFSGNGVLHRGATTELRSNASQQFADVTVTVQDVRRRDGLWDVRLAVAFDREGTAFESHRGWIFSNPACLRDASGAIRHPAGVETLSQRGSQYELAFTFDVDSLAEYEFVYRTPATVIEVPLHYELQNIPLP